MPAPKLSKTPPPKPKNITKADIEQYLALEAERKEANRQAYLLGKKAAGLKDAIMAFVAAKCGGKTRSITRSGFRLSLLEVAGSVAWKAAYVALAGQERADELVAEAPTKDELQVERL